MTTATLAGSTSALQTALDVLGRDGLGRLLPYLQTAALESELQRATEAAGVDVDALRKQAAALVGQEEPGLIRLRRVRSSAPLARASARCVVAQTPRVSQAVSTLGSVTAACASARSMRCSSRPAT